MKVGDAIRTARALRKLKQHELAALIGVSQQMVSEWENERERCWVACPSGYHGTQFKPGD